MPDTVDPSASALAPSRAFPRWPGRTAPPSAPRGILGIAAAAAALALLVLLASAGYAYQQRPRVDQSIRASLRVIAEQRAARLSFWIADRRADILSLAGDAALAEKIRNWQAHPDDPELLALITSQLAGVLRTSGYSSVQLIDAAQHELARIGTPPSALSWHARQVLHLGTDRSPVDLALIAGDSAHRRIGLCWATPLQGEDSPQSALRVVDCTDLEGLSFQPGPPPVALLGDALLLLHGEPLLIAEATDLHWRRPDPVPSTVLEGAPVLTESAAVPGTPFVIEARADREVGMWPMYHRILGVGLAGFFALLAIALVLVIAANRERARRVAAALAHAEQTSRCFSQFFELPFLGMGMLESKSLRWLQVNPMLCEITGYAREELLAMTWAGLSPTLAATDLEGLLQEGTDGCSVETQIARKTGGRVPIAIDLRRTGTPDRAPALLLTLRDLTEQKVATARIARLTKLHAALSHCNKAIVQSGSPEALFPRVCQDAVLYGGMKMAWIGIGDTTTRIIHPVACFGEGVDYLLGTSFSTDPGIPAGQGPSGIAIRENRPVWCPDFQADPLTEPWRERGAAFGWGAAAALPLRRNGLAVGILALYAGEPEVFTLQAQQVLLDLAMDIGFALENFARNEARTAAVMALRDSEAFNIGVIDSLPEYVVVLDDDGRIVTANQAWRRFLVELGNFDLATNYHGRPYTEIGELLPTPIDPAIAQEVSIGVRDVLAHRSEFLDTRYDSVVANETRWFRMRVTPLKGRIAGAVITHENVTKHKAALAHIQQLAHFDSLTGLPNRALLADRVSHDLSRAKRGREQLAVLFMDLDRFKYVNDSLGHRIGDNVLRQAAARLQTTVRAEDTVARLGGDEFILVLPNTDAAGAAHAAHNLLASLSGPFSIDQHELILSASLGIAMYPADGETYDDLSRCADIAMYRAKRAGRNTFEFFTAEMQARSVRTLRLETALRKALELEQFRLCYQPQVLLATNEVTAAEALLRWYHPELGEVSPAEFIPIAEDCGLILPIGDWVLREAARQVKAWRAQGLPPLAIAVNLSPVQFRQANLALKVTRVLEEVEVAPQCLELELTEGTAMDDPVSAVEMMDKLHEVGVRLAIDDFGTGYSSLSYLKRFHVSKLKIDQSFVRNLTEDPEDRAIVRALVTMAHSLELTTLAEGVATEEQLAFLREQGCDAVQGFLFSKPLAPKEFAKFVLAWPSAPGG